MLDDGFFLWTHSPWRALLPVAERTHASRFIHPPPLGLHWPTLILCGTLGAAQFMAKASEFQSSIRVRSLSTKSEWADAKSILCVLTLGVEVNHQIEVALEGQDAELVRCLRDRQAVPSEEI